MEREVGEGIGMGNTCKPMAVSFQCMTKVTTNKKNNNNKKKKKERNPSPPLALFVIMLPKAHLTSRSRMSGSR